jgi:hypothetical protein
VEQIPNTNFQEWSGDSAQNLSDSEDGGRAELLADSQHSPQVGTGGPLIDVLPPLKRGEKARPRTDSELDLLTPDQSMDSPFQPLPRATVDAKSLETSQTDRGKGLMGSKLERPLDRQQDTESVVSDFPAISDPDDRGSVSTAPTVIQSGAEQLASIFLADEDIRSFAVRSLQNVEARVFEEACSSLLKAYSTDLQDVAKAESHKVAARMISGRSRYIAQLLRHAVKPGSPREGRWIEEPLKGDCNKLIHLEEYLKHIDTSLCDPTGSASNRGGCDSDADSMESDCPPFPSFESVKEFLTSTRPFMELKRRLMDNLVMFNNATAPTDTRYILGQLNGKSGVKLTITSPNLAPFPLEDSKGKASLRGSLGDSRSPSRISTWPSEEVGALSLPTEVERHSNSEIFGRAGLFSLVPERALESLPTVSGASGRVFVAKAYAGFGYR